MHLKWKARYILYLMAFFILFLFVMIKNREGFEKSKKISICFNGEKRDIQLWRNDRDDLYYAFIPTYSEVVDDVPEKEETDYVSIELGSLPTLFVNTTSKTMKEVDNNKSHKEFANIDIFTDEGEMHFLGSSVKIKGHGNSTWKSEKKPYELIFDNPVSILEMPQGEKWVLLANAFDESNIRNALVYEFANSIEMENVPQYRFVNVFFNGIYNGLYVLTNAPEDVVGKDTYLLQSDSYYELKDTKTVLNNDISVCVVNENIYEKSEVLRVLSYVNLIDEQIIEGAKKIDDILDVETWVKKYLIDEIFENYDAGITSSYFYLERNQEGFSKIIAGPLWDYDNIIANPKNYHGTTYNPKILFANRDKRDRWSKLWYSALYNNPIFHNMLVETYKYSVSTAFDELIFKKIDQLNESISVSQKCDEIRWGYSFSEEEQASVIEWLEARKCFLDSLWINNENYHIVTLTDRKGENVFWVPDGGSVIDDPYVEEIFSGDSFTIGKNEDFDLRTPIFEDANYSAYFDKSFLENISDKVRYNKGFVLYLLFLIGAVILLILDLRQNKKEKGANDGYLR